ncbi:hypothetical protein [Pseudomonas sp.]|uniref:hypothetical protein n=1 Tax=Pseudomonas sp. TaxID=306 RepID=UPI00326492F2
MREHSNIKCLNLFADIPSSESRRSVYFQKLLQSNHFWNLTYMITPDRKIDIGAWCYSGRKTRNIPKKVDPQLFHPERVIPLTNLMREIITLACTDRSIQGASAKLIDFSALLKYSEENSHGHFLSSPEIYHTTLRAFTEDLILSNREEITKARLQSVSVELGYYMFPESNIDFNAGLQPIYSRTSEDSYTKPPAETEVKIFHNVCMSIFDEVADFILNHSKFPHPILINGERTVLTTEAYPFLSESIAKTKPHTGAYSPFVDYATGLCKSYEEALQLVPDMKPAHFNSFTEKSRKDLFIENSNPYSKRRVRLHKLAHDSFLALFSLYSGANEAPLIDAPWHGDFEILKGKKGERIISIKSRGGVQLVTFHVASPFIKKFRKFLKLREHILNGKKHDYLFVGLDYRFISDPVKLKNNALYEMCTTLRTIFDVSFPILSYRRLRAYKDYWLVQNHGINSAAALLQHSRTTQRKNYTNIEEREAVEQIVLSMRKIIDSFEAPSIPSIPAGQCAGAQPVKSVTIPNGYEPDCKNGQGCIFCESFRVTADAECIHKLISMEYVIKRFIHTCDNVEQFVEIHQPALDTINALLSAIKEKNNALEETISEIRYAVYVQHTLTDYWEKYLERFIKIGALK